MSETTEETPKEKRPGAIKDTAQAQELARRSAEVRRRKRLEALGDIATEDLPKDLEIDPQRVRIWERRMINPMARDQAPILFKDGRWVPRWINTAITGRYHRALYLQGWQPVKVSDLSESCAVLGFTALPDGTVTRGDRGSEVLCKLPKHVSERIQQQKATKLLDRVMQPVKPKDLAEDVGREFGDEAAAQTAASLRGLATTSRGPETFD